MPDSSWTLVAEGDSRRHRIFRIREDRYRLEDGPTRAFVVIDSPDWVNVVPVTDDGDVVLIRQFRHGIREVTLEIPGGMIDAGEEPAAAALRELAEETGYVSDRAELLGTVWPNPAIQNNSCHCFLARGCVPRGAPRPDPFERIELVVRPLADVPGLVRSGAIRHALVLNAFGLMGVLGP